MPSSPTPVQPDEPSRDARALCPMPSRRYPTQSPCSAAVNSNSPVASLPLFSASSLTTLPPTLTSARTLPTTSPTRASLWRRPLPTTSPC
ncbi:hypothetical protein M0R45_017594 [Rubus argutus]|uniref:Uncharacterized protein n=1 Tax=Rubus argutus TaxID=59490 RepID=A0AAW1XVZ8_RUBAR